MNQQTTPAATSCRHSDSLIVSGTGRGRRRPSFRRHLLRIPATLLLLLVLAATACSNGHQPEGGPDIPFERLKWNAKEDGVYTYRRRMVVDLLQHKHWDGVTKDSLIVLLGKPDDYVEGALWYAYDKELTLIGYSTNLLVFDFAPDGMVKAVRLDNSGPD